MEYLSPVPDKKIPVLITKSIPFLNAILVIVIIYQIDYVNIMINMIKNLIQTFL